MIVGLVSGIRCTTFGNLVKYHATFKGQTLVKQRGEESIVLLNSKFRKLINNVIIYPQVCYLSAKPQFADHLFHKNNLKPVNHYFSAELKFYANPKIRK